MSLRAYQQTAARAESPRETEYRLFGQVTRALMEAAKLDPSDLAGRMEALDWNRRLWSALAVDCGDEGNGLVEGLRARGHRSVVPLPGPEHLAEMVHAIAKPGDFVVCLGAGNITQWAANLPGELTALQASQRTRAGGAA